MGFLIFLGIVLGLFLSYFIAREFSDIAHEKGYDDSKYFWYTFFMGICGALMVIALPDRKRIDEGKQKMYGNNTKNEDSSPEKSIKSIEIGTVESIDKKEKKVEENEGEYILSRQKSETHRIACPACKTWQNADRYVCLECGYKFK